MSGNEFVTSLVKNCLFAAVIVGIVSGCLFFAGLPLAMISFHDAIPNEYKTLMRNFLGVKNCGVKLIQINLEFTANVVSDADFLHYAISARDWILQEYGVPIDIGILLSIDRNESGGRTNMGTCSGITAATSNSALNSAQEEAAARELLATWRESGVTNPYINSDYSDYTGHCSAGEIGGGGFIPTTALQICKELKKSTDPSVHACNFWDPKVQVFAEAYWLKAIGYSADQTESQKVESLFGWNQNFEYRQVLVVDARQFNDSINSSEGVVAGADKKAYTVDIVGANVEFLKKKTAVDRYSTYLLFQEAGLTDGIITKNEEIVGATCSSE